MVQPSTLLELTTQQLLILKPIGHKISTLKKLFLSLNLIYIVFNFFTEVVTYILTSEISESKFSNNTSN